VRFNDQSSDHKISSLFNFFNCLLFSGNERCFFATNLLLGGPAADETKLAMAAEEI
jgi:hypothetical protein